MTKEELENQLKDLADGTQDELLVQREDFILFLEVWNKHPQKKSFIGEAQLGGNVIYRYQKE